MANMLELVNQVKQLQREGAREQWGLYCAQYGKTKRDPMTHDADFLSTFIQSYQAGVTFDGQNVTEQGLVGQVKQIQREGGKQLWWKYCMDNGAEKNDPALNEESFLAGFITAYQQGLLGQPDPNDIGKGKGKGDLGELVKEVQRGSTAFKDAWQNYCAWSGGGKNDPSKHNRQFIVGFLDYLGKTAMGDVSGGGAMGGGGGGGGGGGASWDAGWEDSTGGWEAPAPSFGAAGGKGGKGKGGGGGGAGGPYGKQAGKGAGGGGGGGGDEDDMSVLLKLLSHPGLQDMW